MKRCITLIFLLVGTTLASIEYNASKYDDYMVECEITSAKDGYVVFQERGERKTLTVPVNNDVGLCKVTLKKENDRYYYREESSSNWKMISPNNDLQKKKTDDVEYQRLKITPLKATSINSSWGRIKYLFTNNQ